MAIRLFFLALFAALLAAPVAADMTQQGNLRAKQHEMIGDMMDIGIEQDKHYVGTEMETMDGTERRAHMGKKAKEVLLAISEALNGEMSLTATAQVGFSLCIGGGVAGNVDLGLKFETSVEITTEKIAGVVAKIYKKMKDKKWSKLTKAFETLDTWIKKPSNFKNMLAKGAKAWSDNAASGVSQAESGKLIDPAKASASLELKLGIVVSPVSGGIPVPTFSLKNEFSLSTAMLKTQDPPFGGLDWGKSLDGDATSDGSLGCIAELKASITVGTTGVATSASGPATWKCVGAIVALLWEIIKAWAVKNFSGAIDTVSGGVTMLSNKLNAVKGDLVKVKDDAKATMTKKADSVKSWIDDKKPDFLKSTPAVDKKPDSNGFTFLGKKFGAKTSAELGAQADALGSMFDESCDDFPGKSQCDLGGTGKDAKGKITDARTDKTYDAQPALKKMSGFFKRIFSKLGGAVKSTGADINKQSGWGFALNFGVGLGDMSPGIKIYHQSDLKGTLKPAPGGDVVDLNVDEFSAEK